MRSGLSSGIDEVFGIIESMELLDQKLKSNLGLQDRQPPEFFEPSDKISGTPYAAAIKLSLSEIGLSGVFCVNGVPTIAILKTSEYDVQKIAAIHAALWNQGLANILLVISGEIIRVFSLARTPLAEAHKEFEDRCLIEALEVTTSLLKLQSIMSGAETGRLWRESSNHFNPRERVDAVLLGNLEQALDQLVNLDLTVTEAQTLLIQTMFIAYLEDRAIIDSGYYQEATKIKDTSWSEILSKGDIDTVNSLFSRLENDFNGDLFFAAGSFSQTTSPRRLNQSHLDILFRFRDGREIMSQQGGQLRFWGYDFRYIPVELISAVYDKFLGYDEENRKKSGAFFTPMFLADTVVSSVWDKLSERQKDAGVFLDPACGSGIFLVRSFQKLCDHWRDTKGREIVRWDSLKKILSRLQGRDINAGAVRVAVFSLYLALLEQISPPDLRNLLDKGRLLPPLWGHSLIEQDFFKTEPTEMKADVILGNPPWTSRRGQDRSAIDWCKQNGFLAPIGEEAWGFVWKSELHLKKQGLVAYLLPAMGFVSSSQRKNVQARARLFKNFHIHAIINFSDLRFQLFDGAIRPASLFLYTHKNEIEENYDFEYLTPKSDLNIATRRFISLTQTDKATLSVEEVTSDPLFLKQALWLRGPARKLFNFLDRLPKLGDKVVSSSRIREDSEWQIGRGFEPYLGNEKDTPKPSEFVGRFPNISIKEFNSISLDVGDLPAWKSSEVRRRGFEQAFCGVRILIPRGVNTAKWRLRASFVEGELTFNDAFQAISVPNDQSEEGKFVNAILNSRLAVWFAFHGTTSFGSERPEVKQGELLRLPLPAAKETSNEKKSEEARKQLIAIIDRHSEQIKNLLNPSNLEEKLLEEIDSWTYSYFNLTDEEIIITEDSLEYVIPASQPSRGTFPEIWKNTLFEDRKAYTATLAKRLSAWFDHQTYFYANLVAKNLDYGLFKITISEVENVELYSEKLETNFSDALAELAKNIGQSVGGNFVLIPDLRFFVGKSLYLVKPLQKRFWLRSTALADADSIAADLQLLAKPVSQLGETE